MATYRVRHEDGRTTNVVSTSSDESTIKKQANHAETSRVIIAGRRGHSHGPDPSLAVAIEKIKE